MTASGSTTSNRTKQSSLTSSRHNPDFTDRTFAKRLEIEDRVSAFRRLLAAVVRRGDEEGFEECYARARGLEGKGDMRRMGGGMGVRFGFQSPPMSFWREVRGDAVEKGKDALRDKGGERSERENEREQEAEVQSFRYER